MDITKKIVRVNSFLVLAGHTDDGQEYHAEVYRLEIVDDYGNRWVHQHSFRGFEKFQGDDGDIFHDVRPEAKAKAERLAGRIRSAGTVDLQHWVRSDPVYGSRAYIAEDQGFIDA